jgi:hypothetical protein
MTQRVFDSRNANECSPIQMSSRTQACRSGASNASRGREYTRLSNRLHPIGSRFKEPAEQEASVCARAALRPCNSSADGELSPAARQLTSALRPAPLSSSASAPASFQFAASRCLLYPPLPQTVDSPCALVLAAHRAPISATHPFPPSSSPLPTSHCCFPAANQRPPRVCWGVRAACVLRASFPSPAIPASLDHNRARQKHFNPPIGLSVLSKRV